MKGKALISFSTNSYLSQMAAWKLWNLSVL